MPEISLAALLRDGLFCIVNTSDADRLAITAKLQLLEPKIRTVEFASIEACLAAWKDSGAARAVTCVIFGISEGHKKCAQFLMKCSELNMQMCYVATGESIANEDLRALISSGVSQVLLQPFDEAVLGQKILLAAKFQEQLLKETQTMPTINEFSCQIERVSGQIYIVHLHGWVTANAELPSIVPDLPKAKLFLDLEALGGLNSIGVRKWLFWLKDLESNGFVHFEYENVHPRVLAHVNTVIGFRSSLGQVNSFYLVYDSEKLELEKEVKFRRDQDFDDENMILPQIIEINQDGQQVLLDLDPKYKNHVQFYKGKVSMVARARKKIE